MMNRIFIEQNPTGRVDQDQLPARAARQTASWPPSGQRMRTAPARLLGSGPKRSRKLPKLQATHFPSRPGREHWTPIRKSCILQKLSAPVAQGIEYWPPKPRVARSIRAGRATSPSWWGLHVRIHPCPAYPHHRPLPAGCRCPGFGLRHRTLLHCRHPAGLAAHAAGRRHAGGCSPRRLIPPSGRRLSALFPCPSGALEKLVVRLAHSAIVAQRERIIIDLVFPGSLSSSLRLPVVADPHRQVGPFVR